MADNLSEGDFVRLASQGDREAFAVLVERHWEALRRWLWGLTGNAQESEDLTQEAFFRAWQGIGKLRVASTFRVWLFRIARNLWMNQVRKAKQDEKIKSLAKEAEAAHANPLTSVLQQEGDRKLLEALAQLPDHYRAVYLLASQEDLSNSQIAEVLEITEENVRWRLCKARKKLLFLLQAYLNLPKP